MWVLSIESILRSGRLKLVWQWVFAAASYRALGVDRRRKRGACWASNWVSNRSAAVTEAAPSRGSAAESRKSVRLDNNLL